MKHRYVVWYDPDYALWNVSVNHDHWRNRDGSYGKRIALGRFGTLPLAYNYAAQRASRWMRARCPKR